MAEQRLSLHSRRREAGHRLSVLVPRPFTGPLDYKFDTPLAPGTVVRVPLGRQEVIGCVWEAEPTHLPVDLRPPRSSRHVAFGSLRAIISVETRIPALPETLRHFIDWVAAYGLSAPGMVLAIALRVPAQGGGMKPKLGWARKAGPLPESLRLTPARNAVLAALAAHGPASTAALSAQSGASAAVIRGLAHAGVLEESVLEGSPMSATPPEPDYAPPTLSAEQAEAAHALIEAVEERAFNVTLLEGVTGSGKTEVYFEAVAAALRHGRQVLVLVPEIALTTQWTERFAKRFGTIPAIWHSDLGQKARRETWRAVADGQQRVVVGARSALFLPFAALGLVVVDEEHESTYKQEEGVLYHGRDMAIVRARLAGAAAILVSATPSMETLVNVQKGRFRHEVLESRHGPACMPEISLIDMRDHGPERGLFLSPLLCESIEDGMKAGEQSMLFLNRRGYAPLTLCRACGHRIQCPHCAAWMVEHRRRRILACHHCDYTQPLMKACPACEAEDSLVPIGPGIERIHEEVQARFPEARLLVMASDTLTSPAAMEEAVRKIAQKEVDLIIGTQIVAKGWHFPDLTLVGVVDADLGLGGGDLRAAERTMQLLHQVAGRAGRGSKPGRVMLQSYVGDHPVMQALIENDFIRFMEQEAAQRRPGFWPPYGRLAAVIVSAPKETHAEALARHLALNGPHGEGMEILGPAPAPLALLRGRYRFRLLLRTRRDIALQPVLHHWLAGVTCKNDARIDVDVDPVSFM
ncbi:primosomal protein N' [Parasaccharibacter apium]|nr:primosomal protein N' [Parasaccharibacter apium]